MEMLSDCGVLGEKVEIGGCVAEEEPETTLLNEVLYRQRYLSEDLKETENNDDNGST